MIDAIVDGLRAALGPVAIYYAIAAIGLNLHFGFTGLLNFGQVGFMLVSAYGLAVSVAIYQLPFLVGILIGLGLAVLLALLLGIPTLRLRADYLAITTIAGSEILRFITRSSPATDLTAGPFGMPSQISEGRGFADAFYDVNFWLGDLVGRESGLLVERGTYGIGNVTFNGRELFFLVVGWSLVVLFTLGLAFLIRSPWGRVIKAIREDEDAVRALGKNVFVYKMQSLIIGGTLGGVAGILLILNQAAISADIFVPLITFYTYAILILGGTATTWGPVLGAVLFQFLISSTDSFLRSAELLPNSAVGPVRFMLVGGALMLLTIFRPQGLVGDRQEMMLDA